ncbi:MAG TPA: plastocyanin/azurin family copper-binding protein [Opitutus sp.]|nr:plastocyanin/azurin family copper-binding protein [Opitutus sp.]
MTRTVLPGVALAALAAAGLSMMCGSGCRRAAETEPTTTHTVTVEGLQFSPRTLTVREGDRIHFRNTDLMPHTVTATAGQQFDSGLLESGKTWSVRCDRRGETAYFCAFHPTMTGTINVLPRE